MDAGGPSIRGGPQARRAAPQRFAGARTFWRPANLVPRVPQGGSGGRGGRASEPRCVLELSS
eukprot:14527773-Alexandrium_andersonii.AAC.1